MLLALVHMTGRTRPLSGAALTACAALAAVGLGACDRLLVEPAPPPAMALSFALSSALAEATTAELYDQANRLAIRVTDVETESVLLDDVFDFSPSEDTRVRVNIPLENDEATVRYVTDLRDGDATLLRGTGTVTLVKGRTAQVEIELRAGERRTITFDELPTQPVHGVSVAGANFQFFVNGEPSDDALFHGGGPGQITHVQDPSLEGTTDGSLVITFDSPTPLVQFGAAIASDQVLTPGVRVSLNAPDGGLINVVGLTTEPLVSFSEGHFSHEGALVSRVIVSFPVPVPTRFALDNLTFEGSFADEAGGTSAVHASPVGSPSRAPWQ